MAYPARQLERVPVPLSEHGLAQPSFTTVVVSDNWDERRRVSTDIGNYFPRATVHGLIGPEGFLSLVRDVVHDTRIYLLLVLKRGGLQPILTDIRGTPVPRQIDHIFFDAQHNSPTDLMNARLNEMNLRDRAEVVPTHEELVRSVIPRIQMWLQGV